MKKEKLGMQEFKQILDLRDGYAGRRQNERIELVDKRFGCSNELAINKHAMKKDFLNDNEGFCKNRHSERMELLKERMKS